MTYSKKDIIEEIEKVSQKVSGEPSRNDMKEHGDISLTTVGRIFGQWSDAKEEAGFEVNRQKWNKDYVSKEEISVEIERVSKEYCNGKTPREKDFGQHSKYSSTVCEKRFGSWNDAVKYSGFEINRRGSITSKEILQEIKKVSEENCDGEAPTVSEIEEYGEFGEGAIRNHFSSYPEALKEADIKPSHIYDINKNVLLEEIQRLSEKKECHRSPTKSDMREHGKYSAAVYERKFGTWNNAIEKAGFESYKCGTRTWNKTPEEDIFRDIERIIIEECNGGFPTMKEYEKYTIYSRSMLQRRIGGLWEAAEEMGYKNEEDNWYPTGSQHYAWTGGYEYYYGESWSKQNQKAITRANNCEICDGESSYMDVHHITPKRYWNVEEEHEKMNDLRNLVYLCRSCHRKLEGKFKGRNYEEFKQLARDYLDMDEEAIGQPPVNDSSVFDY